MRTLILILTLFWSFELIAQNLDSIGINDRHFLNNEEVKLLNTLLEKQRDTLDLTDKKVAFVTGSSGSMIKTKSDYFENSVKPWIEKDSKPQIFIVLLTEDEKRKSGGYDVLVLSWVKLFTDRRKRKIIEQLGTKTLREK